MFDEYVSFLLILFSHQINICISTKGYSKSLSLFVFLVIKVKVSVTMVLMKIFIQTSTDIQETRSKS